MRSATLRRDRHYALTLLVEAHRTDESLDALIDRFGRETALPAEAQGVRIDLLRERGRTEEAVALFRVELAHFQDHTFVGERPADNHLQHPFILG